MVIPQIKALFNVNQAFKEFEDPKIKDQLTLYKLAYIAIHLMILTAAIYKFSGILESKYCNGLNTSKTNCSATFSKLRTGKSFLFN